MAMSLNDSGCAPRFRAMTVLAAIGTAAALISPAASADSTLKDETFGAGVPFGVVDTPLQHSTGITGSIAVTGWALDDLGVTAVRIVRDRVADEPAGQRVPVGNAVQIAGARPDIAASYPWHPNNTRAGWGYLLLTNMLPNQGNGTFTFHIFADDANGNATLLGSRTISCANAAATSPFGAIDTPTQGQTVSGVVNNFGWVLSPGARRADPLGGGTVNVVIDGVLVGSPSGWTSRPDIAALLPAGQDSSVTFAVGVLTLNSASLTNGVHTIAWVVTDSQGGAAAVGSRYFTVANGKAVAGEQNYVKGPRHPGRVASGAVLGRRGFDFNAPLRRFSPNGAGVVVIHAEELDRIELRLGASAGRLLPGIDLAPGARVDPQSGTFTWQPGPGFIGPYDWVFETSSGERRVRVVLHPKQSNKAFAPPQQAQTKRHSWMRRHPVLSGALIGSGVGALGGATFGSDCGREEHFCSRTGMVQISTAAGAGVGALIGLAVGLIR
jgi:hypothetical protein